MTRVENPYLFNHEQLLLELMKASLRAGYSNSGLVISFAAESDRSRASYLQSIVLSRLDGVQPPLMPGDQVQSVTCVVGPSPSNGWKRNTSPREMPHQLTINSVHYMGNGSWEYIFSEQNDATADKDYDEDGKAHNIPLRFKAVDFQPVAQAVTE